MTVDPDAEPSPPPSPFSPLCANTQLKIDGINEFLTGPVGGASGLTVAARLRRMRAGASRDRITENKSSFSNATALAVLNTTGAALTCKQMPLESESRFDMPGHDYA